MSFSNGRFAFVCMDEEGRVTAAAIAALVFNPENSSRNGIEIAYKAGDDGPQVAVSWQNMLFKEGSPQCPVWRGHYCSAYGRSGGHDRMPNSYFSGMIMYDTLAAYAVLGMVFSAKEVIVVSREQVGDMEARALCQAFLEDGKRLHRLDPRVLNISQREEFASALVDAVERESDSMKRFLEKEAA